MEWLTFAERLRAGDRVRFQGIEGRHAVERVLNTPSGPNAGKLTVLLAGGKQIACPPREFVWVKA